MRAYRSRDGTFRGRARQASRFGICCGRCEEWEAAVVSLDLGCASHPVRGGALVQVGQARESARGAGGRSGGNRDCRACACAACRGLLQRGRTPNVLNASKGNLYFPAKRSERGAHVHARDGGQTGGVRRSSDFVGLRGGGSGTMITSVVTTGVQRLAYLPLLPRISVARRVGLPSNPCGPQATTSSR